jgi:antitoxin HigA-1
MAKKLPPIHPGEVLREEFLRPLNLSPYAVAHAVGVPRTRIERLANEQTPVTADTALRLGRYFGTSAAFWMGIQTQYDLERAEDELRATLRKIAPARAKPNPPPERCRPQDGTLRRTAIANVRKSPAG